MAKSIFGAAPTDEFALVLKARRLAVDFCGKVPATIELRELAKEHGNDLAAAVFNECVRQTEPHSSFIRNIDTMNIDAPLNNKKREPIQLVLVPALGYKKYRFAGGDGGMVTEVASMLGMTTTLVQTSCRATIKENSRIVAETLDNLPHQGPIIIASISKAALEVRRLFDVHPDLVREKRVVAWLSICGMPNGASVVERLRDYFNVPLFRLSAMLAGMPIELVRQMCRDHEMWHRGLKIPNDILVINVVAIPLLWHMQRSGIIRRYHLIGDWGPNDGAVLIGDSPALPGLIYPVWGADHYMRVPGTSFLIHKILRHVLNIAAK